jgi:superfamily II DNA or RNA helicase
MTKWKWRPYQIKCKQAIKEKLQAGVREQLIVQATGTGKRAASVDLMRHFDRSLFIAHREELIIQAYNDIEKLYPMQVGIIKAQRFELDKKIVVASVQTLYNRLDKIHPETFDLIIVDESHHYISRTFLSTVRHFKPKLLTGWTATPKRLDGLSMSNLFQEIVYEYRIEDGIKEGFLANIDAYQVQTQIDLKGVNKVAGDFNQKQLSEKVDIPERNRLIVNKYRQYADGRQAIAFCVDINHAYNLRDKFRDFGIDAETVVSDPVRCPNRTELVNKFLKGEIQVLTNVMILSEGFDYHDVGAILQARPTQSETVYIQQIGRGTRLKSEKYKEQFNTDKCIVLDFVDNTAKHSLVNAWTLENGKSLEERVFIPDEHRDKLLDMKKEREARIDGTRRHDSKVDLLKLPEVQQWQSVKMLEPATEKQLDWIKRLGLFQEDVEYTKAMASEVISGQQAYPNQIKWLAENGYDTREKVTLGQYYLVKKAYDNKHKFQPNPIK